MSGSRRLSDLRRVRHPDEADLAVTEASFQNLALTPSAEGQPYSSHLQPYQAAIPQYQPQAFAPVGEVETSYFPPTYGLGTYSATPSSSYSGIPPQGTQLNSRSSLYPPTIVPSQPTMSGPGLRYYRSKAATTESS